jgi:hypothetical protein
LDRVASRFQRASLRSVRHHRNKPGDRVFEPYTIESLPSEARPGAEGGPKLLARAGSAGATHDFAAACRQRGVGFSFGFPITEDVRLAISLVPEDIWEPAIEADGEERDGAYLAELTRMLDLSP